MGSICKLSTSKASGPITCQIETTGQGSSIRKSGGFHSSGSSQIFSQTVNEVGTYYYASTNNLNTDLIFGEVTVIDTVNIQSNVDYLTTHRPSPKCISIPTWVMVKVDPEMRTSVPPAKDP